MVGWVDAGVDAQVVALGGCTSPWVGARRLEWDRVGRDQIVTEINRFIGPGPIAGI
jgi:hypothetical protein